MVAKSIEVETQVKGVSAKDFGVIGDCVSNMREG